MLRSLLLITSLAILAGCSSTKQVANTQQFCYSKGTIEQTNNDTVNSKFVHECDDRPANNWQLQLGIAENCRPHYYDVFLQGKRVTRRGYVCQKFDGSWEVVPTNF